MTAILRLPTPPTERRPGVFSPLNRASPPQAWQGWLTPLPDERRAVEALLARVARQHESPWQAWMPVLAALMGLRPDEAALLRHEDLVHRRGRPFLDIRRGWRQALTGVRRRCVPIPPSLMGAGFLQFLQSRATGWLFPIVARGAEHPASVLDRWLRTLTKGIPGAEHFHAPVSDLRRACAQSLIVSGADAYFMQAFLGRPVSPSLKAIMAQHFQWGDPEQLLDMIDHTVLPTIVPPTDPAAATASDSQGGEP